MKQIQYRFFKYIINTLDRAINLLESGRFEQVHMIWIYGVVKDVEGFCPSGLPSTPEVSLPRIINGAYSASYLHDIIRQLKTEIIKHMLPSIRVDFMFARPVGAVHLLPVYAEFDSEPRLMVCCVVRDFAVHDKRLLPGTELDELKETLSDTPYTYCADYRVEHSLPDIAVETDPSDRSALPCRLTVPQLKAYISRVVHVPHTFFINEELMFDTRFHSVSSAWLDCCTSALSYETKNITPHLNLQNRVLTGHPFFDISYSIKNSTLDRKLPEKWSIKNEKRLTILWNCEFPDKEYLDILKAALIRYPYILMISRPKPTAVLELRTYEHEHNALEQEFENFLIDRNIDYAYSLIAADAYIGEVSSLYPQFIVAGKPAALYKFYVFPEPSMPFWIKAPFLKNIDDIFAFIDGLLSHDVPRHREISEFERYYIGPTDGNSSRRIKDAALSKFYLEEKNFIDKYCPHLIPEEAGL